MGWKDLTKQEVKIGGGGGDVGNAYNPFHGKGIEVPGSIIGLIGFLIVILGSMLGFMVMFEMDVDIVDVDLSSLDSNFFRGLVIILMANLNGLLVLGIGKIYHFFGRLTAHAERVEAHNTALLAALTKTDQA